MYQCEQCGRQVQANRPAKLKTARFCSQNCKADWQKEHLKGSKNPNYRGGNIERICAYCGKRFIALRRVVKRGDGKFCSYSCSSKSRLPKLMAAVQKKPTKLESKMIQIAQNNHLPFRYVGNGQVIIGGRCPDFIDSANAKVLEVFGNYWHDVQLNPKIRKGATEAETLQHYTRHGYGCLVLWQNELSDDNLVLDKISSFMEANQCD